MRDRPGSGGALEWVVLAALTLTWGSAFAALRIAVVEIHPAWNTAIRLALAALALGVTLAISRRAPPPLWPRPHPAWRWYALSGVAGMALPFLLYAYASTELPSAVTAITNGATPIFVAVLAHFVSAGERLTMRRAVGVTLGFVGLVVLVGGAELRNLGGAHTAALLAALAGAALYAISGVAVRRAPPVGAVAGAFMVCLTGFIVALPMTLLIGGPAPLNASASAYAAVVFLGLIPTGAAMVLWVWLTKRRGALFASMATYIAPVVATILGVVFLDEMPGPEAYVALVLVVAGMVVASRRPKVGRATPETTAAALVEDR